MQQSDFEIFSALMDGVCTMLSRGAYRPNAASSAMFFRALARHPIEVVRKGFDAHVADTRRGQYVPTPADILAQIEGLAADDGRPGAEEAWAVVALANDESETVVWTAEMAKAWTVAQPIAAEGDRIGARMAFKEAYTRLVDESRRDRVPIAWTTFLGHDAGKRHAALEKAEALGLLPPGEALRLAPPDREHKQGEVDGAPAVTLQLLLEMSARREADRKKEKDAVDPEVILEKVAGLKAILRPQAIQLISVAELAKLTLDEQKARAAAKVDAYLQAHPNQDGQLLTAETQGVNP